MLPSAMSRLSLADIDELGRLPRTILDRSALLGEMLEREKFQGSAEAPRDGYVGSAARRKALAKLLDDITMAARWMGAILNRYD